MIPRIKLCPRLALLLMLVIISTQGTQAQSSIQFGNVPLFDFISKLDLRQVFQVNKADGSWLKWLLQVGTGFLDPLYIGQFKVDVDNKEASVHATGEAVTVRRLLLSRLSNVTVEKTKLGISANVTFPKLSLEGVYNLSGHVKALETDLYGRGLFTLTFTNFKLYGALRLNIGRKLLLRLEDLDYTVEGLSVMMDNLMGGGEVSDLLNGIATDVAPIFMDELKSDIAKVIMDEANKALAKFIPKN